MCLYVTFFVNSVCFPLSNLVCFIIVKALKQEIEVLKEEIGNAQLEKAHQVKLPEPKRDRTSAYGICELLENFCFPCYLENNSLVVWYKYICLYLFFNLLLSKPFSGKSFLY
jgi:hypothetical protein